MRGRSFAAIALAGLATVALAGAGNQTPVSPMTPMQAIEAAAERAPLGVRATFEFEVKETGIYGHNVYLNSEDDYRDPRCLTIALPRGMITALERKFGATPRTFFKGKRVRVEGVAKRTRINFTRHGRATGFYYYQTHVLPLSPDSIEVVTPPGDGA